MDTQILYAFVIGFILGALFGALASTGFLIRNATRRLLRKKPGEPVPAKPLPTTVDPDIIGAGKPTEKPE